MPSSKFRIANSFVPCPNASCWLGGMFSNIFAYAIHLCILNLKDTCKEKLTVKLEDEVFLDAKNGDVSLLSESMKKEEENLIKARVKEEEVNNPKEAPNLNDLQFSKLDELLTQTQLYSEFLLEKIINITMVYPLFCEES